MGKGFLQIAWFTLVCHSLPPIVEGQAWPRAAGYPGPAASIVRALCDHCPDRILTERRDQQPSIFYQLIHQDTSLICPVYSSRDAARLEWRTAESDLEMTILELGGVRLAPSW